MWSRSVFLMKIHDSSLFSYFFMITSRGHRPIFWFVMIMMMIKMTHNDDMMIFHDTYTCQHSHELVMKPWGCQFARRSVETPHCGGHKYATVTKEGFAQDYVASSAAKVSSLAKIETRLSECSKKRDVVTTNKQTRIPIPKSRYVEEQGHKA